MLNRPVPAAAGSPFRSSSLILAAVLLVAVSACRRTSPAETAGTYPAPRYPRYLVKPSVDEMMNAARIAVRQAYGRSPLGKMQSGQHVYVLVQYGQDPNAWEAIRRAWAERGVEVTAIGNWDVLGITKEEHDRRVGENLLMGSEGWQELGTFEPSYVAFLPEQDRQQFKRAITSTLIRQHLGAYLDKHPEIQYYYAGNGGGNFWVKAAGPAHKDKFMGNWIYDTPMDMLVKTNTFPGDLWSLIDDKVTKPIAHVTEGDFVDPEGTHLHWTLTAEQAREWAKRTGSNGHLNIYPDATGATWQEGVIRASSNHVGFYPTMAVKLNAHGRVESIEGGGKTGELFREMVNNPVMRNAKYPSAPEPGYWFLSQDGFATNPKFVRDTTRLVSGSSSFGNLSERNRAGVQHFSFASPANTDDPRDVAYAQEHKLPIGIGTNMGHTMHMHVYFPTVKWRLGDTGEWITVADKGHVQAFDDPEARALAAKYGDPAQIFRYEWVPGIPGVNAPRDRERQYATDPWKWIMTEWAQIQSGTYAHYVEDYQSTVVAGTPAGDQQ